MFPQRIRDQRGWIKVYEEQGAYWRHNGHATAPHALLTKGDHSDGFFLSRLVTDDDTLLGEASSDLMDASREILDLWKVKRIVGPQTGATKLAQAVAGKMLLVTGNSVGWASPKKPDDGKGPMTFDDPANMVMPGEIVLLCEDVVTTGGSVKQAADAVTAAGGIVLPFVLSLVNRGGLEVAHGRKVIALINQPMKTWSPADCPLCPRSEAISPKRPDGNWLRLTKHAA
ncbi:MAG: phosphoribosyltransferase family protein [Patescibacteria group bacterium]